MLPVVDFCGLRVTRLVLGANPFGGFSHQNKARDQEMLAYHTPARIVETFERAEAAGINTMVTTTVPPTCWQRSRSTSRMGARCSGSRR